MFKRTRYQFGYLRRKPPQEGAGCLGLGIWFEGPRR